MKEQLIVGRTVGSMDRRCKFSFTFSLSGSIEWHMIIFAKQLHLAGDCFRFINPHLVGLRTEPNNINSQE